MRTAYFDKTWVVGDNNQVIGVALGYDRCAEHEWGIRGILTNFGVHLPSDPSGIEDYRVTEVPENLHFFKYRARTGGKQRKSVPAALLACSALPDTPTKPDGLATAFRVSFPRWRSPEENTKPSDNIQTAWSECEFAIHVQGEENVAHLEALYAAFLKKDVCIAVPWSQAFVRGGLSLCILSQIPEEERQTFAKRCADQRELNEAALKTGVVEALTAAGKKWYALAPRWETPEKKDVVFFLNPHEQKRYRSGWFSVHDLLDWAQDKGLVLDDPALNEELKRPEFYDWRFRLIKSLAEAGQKVLRVHEIWLDEAKTVAGVRIKTTPHYADRLQSGDYGILDLLDQYKQVATATTP